MLTEKELKKCDGISSEIIKKEIIDTQFEIDKLKIELAVLKNNNVEKLKIYMCEVNILVKEKFILKLKFILEHRKEIFKM